MSEKPKKPESGPQGPNTLQLLGRMAVGVVIAGEVFLAAASLAAGSYDRAVIWGIAALATTAAAFALNRDGHL